MIAKSSLIQNMAQVVYLFVLVLIIGPLSFLLVILPVSGLRPISPL